MKKFFILFALQLGLMAALCTTAVAAEEPSYLNDGDTFIIMASEYIDYYNASITADSNGMIVLECTVTGTGIMDIIGVESIRLQKYVSGSWADVKEWNDLYQYDSLRASTYSTYHGTVGSRYRAIVTFYAENENGYDEIEVTTESVTAKN